MQKINYGKKRISFGKIAAYGNRRINEVTVDVELQENEKGLPVFSASAMVWNSKHTDVIMGGQCLDDLNKFFRNNAEYQEILDLWKKHHLNDMHAGTPEQERALDDAKNNGIDVSDYDKSCEYLKSKGLYEVVLNGNETYRYGHSWLYESIPDSDIIKIQNLIA